MTKEEFINFALSLPGTEQKSHFDRQAFRTKRKIYVTLDAQGATINVLLRPELQSVYAKIDGSMIFPVPNKWGLQGWTTVILASTPEELIREVVEQAYAEAL